MGKFNKCHLGYIVKHKESSLLKFRIIDILIGVPETEGDYLYVCSQLIDDEEANMEEIYQLTNYKYHEADLLFVRKPTSNELHALLKEVQGEIQRFQAISDELRIELGKVKGDA